MSVVFKWTAYKGDFRPAQHHKQDQSLYFTKLNTSLNLMIISPAEFESDQKSKN